MLELTCLPSMTPFVSFQSSLAYLRSPPSSYLKASGGSGVDILQGLHDIRQKVSSESYKSQYEFTAAVEQLVRLLCSTSEGPTRHSSNATILIQIRQGRDSHFSVSPILNKVFLFVRGTTLVSVSKDGTSLPEFYEIGRHLLRLQAISEHQFPAVPPMADQYISKTTSWRHFGPGTRHPRYPSSTVFLSTRLSRT